MAFELKTMNNRQRTILQILHESDGYITAGQIAERIGCSERTVRTEMVELKKQMEENAHGKLESKANKGYRLILADMEWDDFVRETKQKSLKEAGYRGLKDEDLIVWEVLRRGGVRISDLEQRLFVSYKNVVYYVDLAENWLNGQRLKLVRKRGAGIRLEGEGHWLRLAEWALYRKVREQISKRPYAEEVLSVYWSNVELDGIFQSIRKIEENYSFHFSYGGYERFAFLAAAMIADQRRKRDYLFPEPLAEDTGWERQAGKSFLYEMAQIYHIHCTEEEEKYIWFALSSSEIMDFCTADMNNRNVVEKPEQVLLVKKLIQQIGEILQQDFSGDSILLGGLLNYISSLIVSRKYGNGGHIYAREPAAENEYTSVYVACWSASHLLEERLGAVVSEYEVSNIASHFAGAIQRKGITADVCLVCTCGMGMSRFLSEQLKGFFPGIRLLDVLTPRDIRGGRMMKSYDLILTTVELPEIPEDKVLKIGNRLRVPDIQQIGRRLQTIHRNRTAENGRLEKNGYYELFSPELVLIAEEGADKNGLIHILCHKMKEQGYVDARFEASVFKREALSATVLSSKIAIPHGFAEHTICSKIAVAVLERPIPWNSYENVSLVFLLALDMRRDPQIKASGMAFYKELVALIDDGERLNELLSIRDPEKMAETLNSLVKTKLKKGEKERYGD